MLFIVVVCLYLEVFVEVMFDMIYFGVCDGDDVLYIDKIFGMCGFEMCLCVGYWMLFVLMGIGKVMMFDFDLDLWCLLFEVVWCVLVGVNFKFDNWFEMSVFL